MRSTINVNNDIFLPAFFEENGWNIDQVTRASCNKQNKAFKAGSNSTCIIGTTVLNVDKEENYTIWTWSDQAAFLNAKEIIHQEKYPGKQGFSDKIVAVPAKCAINGAEVTDSS